MQKKLLFSLIFICIILSIILSACDKEQSSPEIPECDHSFSEWEEINAANCSQVGKKSRICSECDFIDIEYLAKTAHDPKVSETVAPTCTNEGYSIYLCECGYTYKSDYTAISTHAPKKASTVASTCTSEGYSVYLCECGYTYKADYTAPLEHKLKKETVVASTCSEVGYTHYKCEACDYNFKSDYTTQVHEFEQSFTLPTATQSGFTTYTCKSCSYHYDNDFVKYTDILPSPYLESSVPLWKGLDIYDDEHKMVNGEYQPLDWESIKAQGYDFVILKVGSDYSGKSKTFDMDYEGAKAAGLMVGAYYYAYSSTVLETRNDAQEVLEWIKGKQFEMPIYYDIEENSLAANLSKDSLTELITVFIEELQANGYYSALYVNNDWLQNKLNTETVLERFDIWYARYPETENPVWNEEKYGKQLSMWQFSQEGIVEGFDTYVDLNYCYRDYPTLMKQWGLNGFEKSTQN